MASRIKHKSTPGLPCELTGLLHQTFTAVMQDGSIYELERRIARPGGSVRWVYDRAQPFFDIEGKLVRYVGAALDITERKQAEQALRQAQAASKAVD